ncbi:peptide chain release factor N(5)-glutamine methyltransferase [bacterium]|nr:MAG: peptide chain release factor N(5)-glutamine methyltransferase [bacterium]
MNGKKLTKLLDILNYSAELLKSNNIKDARLNVELMLCEALKCDRMRLYLDFDKPLNTAETGLFKSFLKRRLDHEPLQYILGKTNFYGYDILVNPSVLIPRQETEILAELIINHVRNNVKTDISILEIGTGSGCLTVAIAKELEKYGKKFGINSYDISLSALKTAEQNLKMNNVDNCVRLSQCNFLTLDCIENNLDYLILNPPYIPAQDIDSLDPEVRKYEPVSALTDGLDGLSFFRKAIEIIKEHKLTTLFSEIGYAQKESIENILLSYGINNYKFFKDYNGINRVLQVN